MIWLLLTSKLANIQPKFPALDGIVQAFNPALLTEHPWIGVLVNTTMIPTSMYIMGFALACALIQEQGRASAGSSNLAKLFYRLILCSAALAGYSFFFSWIIEAQQDVPVS